MVMAVIEGGVDEMRCTGKDEKDSYDETWRNTNIYRKGKNAIKQTMEEQTKR